MKPADFHPEAVAELLAQAAYYEERVAGLGARFLDQVESAIRLAASMPGIGSPHRHNTRRVFPKDFPLSIVYRETSDSIVILAIAPFRRKPDYWRGRV